VPHESLSSQIKAQARGIGFDLVGVCPAVEATGFGRLQTWLQSGFAGEMHYIPQYEAAYRHPESVLPGVRSIVMLGLNYRTEEPALPEPGQGRVSRYAWGDDYHPLIRERLATLKQFVLSQRPDAQVRGVVDTAPLLEREFAQLAGLGWVGKNTLLLNRQAGSWFFLAALLTDLDLEYDSPHALDYCGTCTACLTACPTQAFVAPYVLDARKCISYLTIELREEIPAELRTGVGDWLFGCDVCQDICPWNRKAPNSTEPAFAPHAAMNPVDLASLFCLSEAEFRERFRNTPLWRAKRRGMLRNAAIVLGNQQAVTAQAELQHGADDADPLIRTACQWALAQISRNAQASGSTSIPENRGLAPDG